MCIIHIICIQYLYEYIYVYISTCTSLAFSGKSIAHLYIDGTDAASEGTFKSSATGNVLTYTNWDGGEPNNLGGENCIAMETSDSGWNDTPCHNLLPSICEMPRKFCVL